MSHLIQTYTVCPLLFDFSICYSLDLTFYEIRRQKFCCMFLVVKELTLLHSERPILYAMLDFLSAIGLRHYISWYRTSLTSYHKKQPKQY